MSKMETKIPADTSFVSVMSWLDGELAELRRTARALYAVGLEKPADEIGCAAEQIAQIRAWVTNYVDGELDKSLAYSRQMTGSILSGLVEGVIKPKDA